MNNCRRLTRRERAQNVRILNEIVDLPANHQDHQIIAYGRPPFPLMDKRDEAPHNPIPGKIIAWYNSPAARSKWIDRFAWRVEPILAALLLVLCAMLLMLSITAKVIAK